MALPQPLNNSRGRQMPPQSREMEPVQKSPAELLERVIIHGDLSKLSAEQKVDYYRTMCETLGLNPMTRPFAYITLNGKLVLYALRDCTDQLRKVHGVSVVDIRQEEIGGVYIVVCKVRDREGREDMARGAVSLGSLKNEALANAIMKAETKAKRRATLSIVGLGVLDETEIEDIDQQKRKSSYAAKKDGTSETFNDIRRQISTAPDLEFLTQLPGLYEEELKAMPAKWQLLLSQEYETKWLDLNGDPEDCPMRSDQDLY